MQRHIENKRSPARADVLNDWRREDRFGNGRRSEDRSSDGGSRPGGRSPDSQISDMSSPPVVRPVRDILGDNVSPLRVIEPPKAIVGKSIDPPPYTQVNIFPISNFPCPLVQSGWCVEQTTAAMTQDTNHAYSLMNAVSYHEKYGTNFGFI